MMIRYVQFISPVQVVGLGGVPGWSADKHGGKTEIEERGAWIFIYLIERTSVPATETTPETVAVKRGRRVRVPMTNVAYIDDDGATDDKRAKA